jgi:hypothetical protein
MHTLSCKLSKFQRAARYTKWKVEVLEVAPSFNIKGDVWLGVWMNGNSIEASCKVEYVDVSMA